MFQRGNWLHYLTKTRPEVPCETEADVNEVTNHYTPLLIASSIGLFSMCHNTTGFSVSYELQDVPLHSTW